MTQVTTAKNRTPDSVRYNGLVPLRFKTAALSASEVSTTIQDRLPLGLNFKIFAVSYVVSGSPAGTASLNIVSGAGSYETAGAAPTGSIALGGTFAIGDTITITVGSITSTFTVNGRNAGNNQLIAASIASGINRKQTFGTAYYAVSSGPNISIINIAYATAGNATAFSTSVSSAAGTSTASGATLAGGAAGVLPTAPALDNSNFPNPTPPYGQTSQTAAAGNALFPTDVPVNLTADIPTTLYPVYPKNFDAIWPAASELTLRIITNGSAAGNIDVILWGVPYDNHTPEPGESTNYFLPSQTIL